MALHTRNTQVLRATGFLRFMDYHLFYALLLAHIISDFYLQTDAICRHKEAFKHASVVMYVHSAVTGALAWAAAPSVGFALCALAIAVSHCAIDVAKAYVGRGLYPFVADQLAHVAVLFLVASVCGCGTPLPEWLELLSADVDLPMLVALALILKPANILIKLILERYDVGMAEACSNMKNAGALIGNLERLLSFVLVVAGQFEAVGFIIAAKSILRFRDTDTAKTEYVLAGSFMSFGIAVVCGLCVR